MRQKEQYATTRLRWAGYACKEKWNTGIASSYSERERFCELANNEGEASQTLQSGQTRQWKS